MGTVLRKRVIPLSVSFAKYHMDTEELRRLGRLGAAKKAEKRDKDKAAQKKAAPPAPPAPPAPAVPDVVPYTMVRDPENYFFGVELSDAIVHRERTRAGWAE